MGRLTNLKPRLGTLDTRRVQPATTGDDRQRGSGWVTTRSRILRRDNGLCQCSDCKAGGHIRLASEVDHVTPLWEGGSNLDANLAAINADCHKRKTAEEAARRGR